MTIKPEIWYLHRIFCNLELFAAIPLLGNVGFDLLHATVNYLLQFLHVYVSWDFGLYTMKIVRQQCTWFSDQGYRQRGLIREFNISVNKNLCTVKKELPCYT